MAPRISLALALHNHQPVGNFGWVFGDVYDQAYRPMLDALERHPGVRLALHYTGPLLDWLRAERPGVPRAPPRARRRAARWSCWAAATTSPSWRRCPSATGWASWRRMADELERDHRPPAARRVAGGAGLGAGPADLARQRPATAGRSSTTTTSAAAAIPEERLWGPYTTDDQGHLLTVFGTEKGLRYRIPFGDVDDVIAYLRDHATEEGDRVGMMGDDGEKFGSWPTTWEHCWGATRWVDRFFEALEANADWLTTITPSDWLDGNPPIGRVYLPTASYAEMGEWALPPDESRVFTDLLHRAEAAGAPESRYLRGGFWRNFQVKYREINDLHKQMLRTSAKVAAMPEGPREDGRARPPLPGPVERLLLARPLRRHLHQPHAAGHVRAPHRRRGCGRPGGPARPARRATASASRTSTSTASPRSSSPPPGQVVAVKPSEGAGIGGWDIRAGAPRAGRRPAPAAGGLPRDPRRPRAARWPSSAAAVAERRRRRLHPRPGEHQGAGPRGPAPLRRATSAAPGSSTSSPRARRPGPSRGPTPPSYGDFVARPFVVEATGTDGGAGWVRLGRDGVARTPAGDLPVRVDKTIARRRRPPHPDPRRSRSGWRTAGAGPLEATLAVEWATTMLGGGGNPAAYYLLDGERVPHDAAGSRASLDALRSGNDYVGLDVATRVEPAAETWISPIDTVSNSEAGFERVYQGSALVFAWPLVLAPGASDDGARRAHGDDDPRPGRRGGTAGAAMTRGRLAIHAHFYQPERRDPFGGPPRPDPSAAPYPTWNARITAECYRPNAERGNLDRISFNVGPTLTRYAGGRGPGHPGRSSVSGARRRTPSPRASTTRSCRSRPRATGGRRSAGASATSQSGSATRPPASGCRRRPSTRPSCGSWPRRGSAGPSWRRGRRRRAGIETRRPHRVDLGGGRSLVIAFYDARPLGSRLVPARRDRRRRPLRPRLGPPAHVEPAPPRRLVELAGGTAARPRGDRRRAVRPPPALPRPVPRAARRPRGRPRVRRGPAGPVPWPPRTASCCRGVRVADRTSWSCHHGVLRWSRRVPVRRRTGAGSSRSAPRSSGSPAAIDTVTETRAAALPAEHDRRASAAASTRGPPGTRTSTSSSGCRRRRRSPPTSSAMPPPCPPGASSRRCWRPSAGAWRCSPATAGTGRSRRDPRRSRSSGARPGRRGSSTGSRAPASSDRLLEDLALVVVAGPRDRRGGDLPGGARRGRPGSLPERSAAGSGRGPK